jgi:hypothetical protein
LALSCGDSTGADAAAPTAPPAQTAVYQEAIPADLQDPAFADAIDLRVLQRAIRNLDRGDLLAAAAKLAQAERRIGRPHKGISADAVFGVLLRAIAEARDRDALEQTAKALEELDKGDLLPAVEQTRKLLSAPRKLDVGPGVPRSEVSAEAIVLYNALKEQIRVAKVVGNPDVLRALRQQVVGLEELHPKQRAYLERVVEESLAALPAAPMAEQLAMSRLTGVAVRGRTEPKK